MHLATPRDAPELAPPDVPGDGRAPVYPDRPSLTRDEIDALRDAPEAPADATEFQRLMAQRDRVLIALLDDTMARVGELVAADCQDVYDLDTEEPLLWIKHPKVKVVWRPARDPGAIPEGAPVHYRTKRLGDGREVEVLWWGQKVTEPRWAPITRRTRDELEAYRLLRGSSWADDEPLLVSKFGRLSEQGARYVLDEHAEALGIQARYEADNGNGQLRRAVTPHAIREAAERELLHEREDTKLLARVVGHSVRVQQRFYNRSNRADVKKLARRKQKMLDGHG